MPRNSNLLKMECLLNPHYFKLIKNTLNILLLIVIYCLKTYCTVVKGLRISPLKTSYRARDYLYMLGQV